METVTFDSLRVPAFGEVYAHRREEGATAATSFRVAAVGGKVGTATTSKPMLGFGDDGGIRRTLSEVMSLWMQASSTARNTNIFCDALEFVGAMPSGVLLPHVWADDAEVVFEWISDGRHAIVSCEGDGVIGYTYRVGGRFVPGEKTAASPDSFPADLSAYLR